MSVHRHKTNFMETTVSSRNHKSPHCREVTPQTVGFPRNQYVVNENEGYSPLRTRTPPPQPRSETPTRSGKKHSNLAPHTSHTVGMVFPSAAGSRNSPRRDVPKAMQESVPEVHRAARHHVAPTTADTKDIINPTPASGQSPIYSASQYWAPSNYALPSSRRAHSPTAERTFTPELRQVTGRKRIDVGTCGNIVEHSVNRASTPVRAGRSLETRPKDTFNVAEAGSPAPAASSRTDSPRRCGIRTAPVAPFVPPTLGPKTYTPQTKRVDTALPCNDVLLQDRGRALDSPRAQGRQRICTPRATSYNPITGN